jgi:hypothetical protein
MKKATMFVGMMLLAAAPLHAYVQPASLMRTSLKIATQPATTLSSQSHAIADLTTSNAVMTESITPGDGLPVDVYRVVAISEELAVRPVPEPGTMAMASMGLLALGFAVRRKFAS